MSESTYSLVFKGEIVPGQDLAEVKKRLQKVFHKDAHTIEKLFSGKKVKIKHGLNKNQADQYKAKMHSIGAVCEVESQVAKAAGASASKAASVAASTPQKTQAESTMAALGAVGSPMVANVVQKPAENAGKPIKLADIDKAFVGTVPKVDLPMTYKVGVVAMGITMVLLPLLYIGLIGLVGYGVLSHSIVNTTWFDSLGAKFGLIAYSTPIVAGITVILFMIKPLFAPPAIKSKTVVLDSIKEPILFHFVNKVAMAVGAPRPKQIEVDCEVNASASFRKGLFSFFGDDLVLTIGMPLLAGFNARQLAGVLAHEFGHFSQGVGMRFHYLAYKINSWFFYSVYVRDSWDEKLDQLASETDNWVSVILNFARGGVWVTRKILFAFMKVGHVVSSYMLRQMEFDADRYEAQVGGSEQFRDTTLRLQRLGVAYQISHDYLEQAWEDKKLVNDFPSLVAHNASKLPEKLDQALLSQMEEAKTHLYDSHPSDRERIANAAAQQAKGIVTLQRHSRELFKRFDYLAKEVSTLYYQHELGLDFDPSKLVDISQVVKIAHDNEKQQEAYYKYFADMAPVFDLPLSVNIFDTSKTDWDELLVQYRKVNDQLADQIANRRMLKKKADDCFTRYQHFRAILDLEDAGFVLFPEWFDLTPEVLEASKKQMVMYEQAWKQSIDQLTPMFLVNDDRLSIALTLLNHPKAIEADPEHALHLKTRNHLSLLVNNIKRNAPAVVDFRNKHARLLAFLSCAHAITGQKQADVNTVRSQLLDELKQSAQTLTAALSRLDYPYVAEGEHQTIADYLETMLPRESQFSSEAEYYLASGNIILEKLDAVYGRIISGLANVALTVDMIIPYIEGRAPKPEIVTQPVIEQETYMPAEVDEAEVRAMQMAQTVGAESASSQPVSFATAQEAAKPKEPLKVNVREIKDPGKRSVFAIDETEDESANSKAEETQENAVAADAETATGVTASNEEKVVSGLTLEEPDNKPAGLTTEDRKVEQSVAGKPDELKVVARENTDAGKPANFAIDEAKPETAESEQDNSQAGESALEKLKLATRENKDAGVRSTFAIDESEPESVESRVEEQKPTMEVVAEAESPAVEVQEDNGAGASLTFASEESDTKPAKPKVAEVPGELKVEAITNTPVTAEAETPEDNDTGNVSSFTLEATAAESTSDSSVDQPMPNNIAAPVEPAVVAQQNKDVDASVSSLSVDDSKPATVEVSPAEPVKPELPDEPAEPATYKSSNPFLSRSAFAQKQEADESVTDTISDSKVESTDTQPESVVVKAPNPFLANISTYKAKLEKEKAEAEAAQQQSANTGASQIQEKKDATFSMDALNPGSMAATTNNAEDKQSKLSSFSTGGLSLESQEDGTQGSGESSQKPAEFKSTDPESVVVQKPDVLQNIKSNASPETDESSKYFVSPGLPNSSPVEERGLRPEPPTDLFKAFGSEDSSDADSADKNELQQTSQQSDSNANDGDIPAANRTGSH